MAREHSSLYASCERHEHPAERVQFFNARPLAKTSLRPPLIAAAASWALAQQN